MLVEKFLKQTLGDEIIEWDGAYSPLFVMFQWNDQKNYDLIHKTPATPILLLIEGRHANMYFNNSYYKNYAKEIFVEYLNNPKKVNRQVQEFEKLSLEIEMIYREIQEADLSIIAEDELLAISKSIYQKLNKLGALTIFIETFDRDIALSVVNLTDKKIIESIWTRATEPIFESFEFRRTRKMLDEYEKNPNFHKYLQFIYTDYFEVADIAEVKKQLKIRLRDAKKIKDSQKELASYDKKLFSSKKRFMKWFEGLNGNGKLFVEFVQMAMRIRDVRKDPIAQVQTLFYRIGKEILRRAGIKDSLVPYIMPIEILQGSKWLSKEKEGILKRPEGMIAYLGADGKFLVVNKKIDSPRKRMKKEILKHAKYQDYLIGQTGSNGCARGIVRIIKDAKHIADFMSGDILVTGMTRPEFLPLMKKASAIITNEGGITCHAAIVARELKKPCIIGTKIATQVLHDGDLVEVDADMGIVRIIKKL